jgi:hypothetical protein
MDTKTLTVEDIDSMEAGAQMDALAAEFIMGWERHSEHLWWDVENSQWWSHDAVEVTSAEVDSPNGPVAYSFIASFNPSTGIFDAWEVVEHLRAQDWEMTLTVNHYLSAPWDCRLFLMLPTNPDAPMARTIAHGATAPLAICRAALKYSILVPMNS